MSARLVRPRRSPSIAQGDNGVDAGTGHLTIAGGRGDIDVVAGRLML